MADPLDPFLRKGKFLARGQSFLIEAVCDLFVGVYWSQFANALDHGGAGSLAWTENFQLSQGFCLPANADMDRGFPTGEGHVFNQEA